jgi:hypothetical protein
MFLDVKTMCMHMHALVRMHAPTILMALFICTPLCRNLEEVESKCGLSIFSIQIP